MLLASWMLVGSAYSGAINPASGIAGLDFNSFYQAAERLNIEQPLYQPNLNSVFHGGLYVYSPLLAILLRPLAHLSFQTAMKAWFFINAASLILSVLLYGTSVNLKWHSASVITLLLFVSFRFWDNTMNFGLGQSNSIMLALIAGMMWADSRKHWQWMGLLIVVAALFKVWLIGLLLYLVLRRRWKEVVLSLIAFVIALTVLFTLVGWSEFFSYVRCMKQAKAFGEIHAVRNSILGFADLHLRANPIVSPLVDSRGVYFVFIAICLALLFWGFVALWRILSNPAPFEARLSFSLVLVSILLLLPSYENGYLVYCYPLLWALLASPDADRKCSPCLSQFMLTGGILFYLIFSRFWPVYAPFPAQYQHGLRSLVVSMSFYGTVMLWGIGFVCLSRLRPANIMPGIVKTGTGGSYS
ncbi:MAG: glycosyltransferase family 87 protein [Janthinobacterium lividum]